MTTIEPKYTTSVTVSGGRQGRAVSDDGVLDVQLRVPKRNGVSDGTNPEQLFAAAWAGCFGSALNYVAGQGGSTPQIRRSASRFPKEPTADTD
jgi:Ohr subfamily peroxiredoxin